MSMNQLVIALAAVLNTQDDAIEPYALALRRERILGPTKRGRGAERASAKDAANLLLAMLSEGPKSSPAFVRRVGALPMRGKVKPDSIQNQLGLSTGMHFIDAIAAVLGSFASGEIYHVLRINRGYSAPSIELHVERPELRGFFKVHPKDTVQLIIPFEPSKAAGDPAIEEIADGVRRIRSDRWLTGRELLTVARIVSNGGTY